MLSSRRLIWISLFSVGSSISRHDDKRTSFLIGKESKREVRTACRLWMNFSRGSAIQMEAESNCWRSYATTTHEVTFHFYMGDLGRIWHKHICLGVKYVSAIWCTCPQKWFGILLGGHAAFSSKLLLFSKYLWAEIVTIIYWKKCSLAFDVKRVEIYPKI